MYAKWESQEGGGESSQDSKDRRRDWGGKGKGEILRDSGKKNFHSRSRKKVLEEPPSSYHNQEVKGGKKRIGVRTWGGGGGGGGGWGGGGGGGGGGEV